MTQHPFTCKALGIQRLWNMWFVFICGGGYLKEAHHLLAPAEPRRTHLLVSHCLWHSPKDPRIHERSERCREIAIFVKLAELLFNKSRLQILIWVEVNSKGYSLLMQYAHALLPVTCGTLWRIYLYSSFLFCCILLHPCCQPILAFIPALTGTTWLM